MKKIRFIALFLTVVLTLNLGVFAVDRTKPVGSTHDECYQPNYYDDFAEIFGVDEKGNIMFPDSIHEFVAILEKNNIAYELGEEGNIRVIFSRKIADDGSKVCYHTSGTILHKLPPQSFGPDASYCSSTLTITYIHCAACGVLLNQVKEWDCLGHASFVWCAPQREMCTRCGYIRYI